MAQHGGARQICPVRRSEDKNINTQVYNMNLYKLWLYFYYSSLKEANAQLLGFNIEMMRYLPLLLKYSTAPLADNEWDFLMCSMLAWLEVIWKHLHF